MGNVTLATANVPEGTCPSWIIALWPQLVGLMTANLNGALNVFNYGNSTPAPADQGKPWIRTNSDGTPDKVYVYSGGNWLAAHALPPGAVMLYEGTEASIATFDGGESATVGPATGPMWERVTELDGKFPLQPGTLASGTVVNIGNEGGEEKHVLAMDEMPRHHHNVLAVQDDSDGSGANRLRPNSSTTSPDAITDDTGGNASDGSTTAHNNMPPYRGIWFLRRTARLYYRV